MKIQKRLFNDMLRRYNKYLRKLGRLEVTGRNTHRQSVLHRHITRLSEKLSGLYISIKGVAALAAVSGMCMLATSDANAQISFAAGVSPTPFGLSGVGSQSAPSFADLDGDGDLDMMTGSGNGIFSYFENTGTMLVPAFGTAVSPSPFGLAYIGYNSTPSFADLDGDGDMDLLSGNADGIFSYFENTGTSIAPAFAAAVTSSPFGLAGIGTYTKPSFADLDSDGDLDMVSGGYDGKFSYFENTGGSIAPAFAAVVSPAPFGLADIGYYANSSFADLDGDGDLDMMASDYAGTYFYFENTGTSIAPAFTTAVSPAPFGLAVGEYPTLSFVDLDGDGDMDMMSGHDNGTFIYFENTTPLAAVIDFEKDASTAPFGLTDIGSRSAPFLIDLDGDGDMDVMAGNNTGNFSYFENTGTALLPDFATDISPSPFGLAGVGEDSEPSFADLDGDGDMDMMAGNYYGQFSYFENTGTLIAPAFAAAVSPSPFGLSDVGYYSAPSFADLDGDGDIDMITGEEYGNFLYFENTGTSIAPVFAAAVTPDPFGLSDTGHRSTPSFVDLDKDGDLDLMVGYYLGDYSYFENTGTRIAPAFAAAVSPSPFGLTVFGTNSNPSFADLDGDGNVDIISGNGFGLFSYFTIPIPLITWDGETDTDWATASNWVGDELPATGVNVIIPDVANDPVITSDVRVNDIEIEAGAMLTITSNSLTASGNITLDGTASVASGASLVPRATISGAGLATIHRNTTFGISDGKYSVIGSPITIGNTSSLGDIVYSYDETIAYEPGIGNSNGANRFEPVATPEAMTVGDAYFSANTGDISFVGMPNTGGIDLPLVYNLGQDGAGVGFNLVSNPYTAAINYNDFVANNADIDGTIYLWDDGGSNIGTRDNSDYITANSMGVASGGSGRAASWDGYIRSVQGFFVKATTAGTLSFTPSMMDDGNNSDAGYFRTEKPTVLKFSLSSDIHFNEILIGFTDKATLAFDRTLDAHKAKGNSDLQFYSRMNDATLAIQALPSIIEETNIDLGFDIAKAGTYTLELKDAAQYGFGVYLKDHKLGKLIDLSEQNAYSFESASLVNSHRFSLVFSPNQVLAIADEIVSNEMIVFSNTNGLNVRMSQKLKNAKVKIYNLSGTLVKEVKQVDFTGADWTTSFYKQGLFIMTIQSEGRLYVKKFLK